MGEEPKTPRGDAYRQRFVDTAKTKLFVPRDREGVPQQELFNIARTLDAALRKHVAYIGVAIHGSRTRGYSEEKSDTDLIVFYDEIKDYKAAGDRPTKSFRAQLSDVQTKLHLGLEQGVSATPRDLGGSSIDQVIKEQKGETNAFWALGDLCLPSAGPYIQEYRQEIGKKIRALGVHEREELVRKITLWAVAREQASGEKRQNRMSMSDFDELMVPAARTKLWKERIMKTYALT